MGAPCSVEIPATEGDFLSGVVARAFEGCSGLISISLPEDCTKIGCCAFAGCFRLTSIHLPAGCTEIAGSAFYGCRGLTSLDLSEALAKIGVNAFRGCSGLTSLDLPEGCTEIGEEAFYGCCRLTSISLPECCTKIGRFAFYGCSGLTSLDLPEGCTEIKYCAFHGCSGLTSLNFPEGCTEISYGAFYGCPWLVVVSFHTRLPIAVDPYAFAGCTRLTLVVAPRASGLVGTVVSGVTVVEDTAANRRRALDLQYWRAPTHWLCSPRRRDWVLAVLLVANRLRGGPLALPPEMWFAILGAIRRYELGPVP
jgi:hypothetical protein